MSEDGIAHSATIFDFSADGENVDVTTDRGSSTRPIVANHRFYRTVALTVGIDFVVYTIFDDGHVIEQFTRQSSLRPRAYVFEKKCKSMS